ncbi:S9 family peptidase [Pedomonas mirosovicensis]|uniref:S9 family peptidase n=1 Tax=Pedomonas mirosovicensis TaxID=2908641 RepID=UPI00216A2DE2|nr:S9 family peptidase [Pedomonas mirosovicensis]MCH8683757.1 S9 family peptidase [Pedomonas mirosovicensis]
MTTTTLTAQGLPQPPVAPQKPYSYTRHGYTIEDPWHWLKDEGYPEVNDAEVLDYLKAENAYFEAAMSPHKPLVEKIYEEMKARLKEDDYSVPAKDGAWEYWWKFQPGAQYRDWYRRPIGGGADELLLSEPALAEGLEYFRLGALEVSPDGKLLAYAADTNGSERFTLKVKDLGAKADLDFEIPGTIGGIVWDADSKGFFYTLVNENWRPYVVKYHRLGTAVDQDPVIYEEADSGFFVDISHTQSRRFLVLSTADHVTSEVRLVPLGDPLAKPVLVSPRKAERQYEVDEREGTLYIRTNDTHKNFRVVTASLDAPSEWKELIPGSNEHYIRDVTSYKNALVIEERLNGLDQIRVRDYAGGEHYVTFPEAAYTVAVDEDNREYALGSLRLRYESMVTPRTTFDYDLAQRKLVTRKVQEIPSGYDSSQYETVRIMAPARDGAQIPVSVVYKKGFKRDGSQPLHLYAYGAYGMAMSPNFSTIRLSLLDRGFAYAIAHIRGGDEMGYQWYLDGKLDKRQNTFNDFVDAAKALIKEGYASKGNISISGGSAGGELMGAVTNMNPELWRAVVAHVPFVDVLNTMQDESLPLTPMEWPEWGNPITDKTAFETIRAYSPYDNVEAKAYPPLLITGGLNDPRVTYWEPAKWAAKLRDMKTDDNLLLLKINMGAGHGGKSGRFASLYEDAEEYVFILKAFGMAEAQPLGAAAAQ